MPEPRVHAAVAAGPEASTITVYRGEDVNIPFTYPGNVVTGWTLVFTVEGSPNIPKLIEKTITSIGGSGVDFTVELLAAETLLLRPGRYDFDVWRTDEGSQHPCAWGTLVALDSARIPVA